MSGFAQSTQVAGDEGGEKSLPLNLHPHPPAKGPAHHLAAYANPIRRNDLRSLDTDVFASTYVDLYSMPNSIRSIPLSIRSPSIQPAAAQPSPLQNQPAFRCSPRTWASHELHELRTWASRTSCRNKAQPARPSPLGIRERAAARWGSPFNARPSPRGPHELHELQPAGDMLR